MVIDLTSFIEFARNYMLIMAFLVLGGGVMGYVKASSKASLISGIVSAVILAIIFGVACNGQVKEAMIASFVTYALLDTVFAMRLMKTKKFMPAGLILIFCVVGQLLCAKAFVDLSS